MTLVERLHNELQDERWLGPGEGIVVAVSGGLDSAVLLDMLVRLQPRWQWSLTVAHLEHDWRTESEAMFVLSLATGYGLPCLVRRVAARPLAAARGRGYEEAARHERYRLLGDMAHSVGATAIVTGHHRDDQAETVLYRLLRGTSPAGLAAIAPVRPLRPGSQIRLVRPLLGFGRHELEEEAAHRRLAWQDDESNVDQRFLRNKLRHTVLPLLEEVRPGAAKQLAQLAAWARRDEDYWRDALAALPAGWCQTEPDGGVSVQTAFLRARPEPLRRRCLEYVLRRAGVAEVTGQHLLALESLLTHPHPSASLHLPAGWKAQREYERLTISRAAEQATAVSGLATLAPGQRVHWHGGAVTVTWQPGSPELTINRSSQDRSPSSQHGRRQPDAVSACLDAASLPPDVPLHVRSRRPGDRVRPAGGTGTKKLQDVFTQAKVPQRWRDRWPIVCRADTDELLWVVGLAVADAYAATADSADHVLLRWEPLL